MSKNLSLVIVCHQGYIRHVENEKDFALENDILFNSISRTYLPLLNLFHRLEDENVKFKVSMVFSPSLCSLLDDEVVQQQYVDWLEKRIAFGEKEVERCKGDSALLKNAEAELSKAKNDLSDYTEKYGRKLLSEFADFSKKGFVELLATCGTYAFLPHYGDMVEILNAQVEVGLYSHRHYFGINPDGFYLPFMGYATGIENVLKSYGIKYTIVDIRSLLFSETVPENGIFTPVRCAITDETGTSGTSLALFGQDCDSPEDVLSFAARNIYKNQGKDVGFELSGGELVAAGLIEEGAARIPSGFKYWNKADEAYDAEKAVEQAKADAMAFISSKNEKLSAAEKCLKDENSGLVCVLDAKLFGQDWAEGVEFLENVVREAASSGIALTDCSSRLSNVYLLQKITPYPGAAQGNGYGEDLLDASNDWMLRYTRKMAERMIDLSDRYPNETGLKIRLLNLGARELMLAQSGEWACMVQESNYPEYAVKRFKDSIKAFMIVFDALGTNVVSTEWLTKMEREHTIFPWMNFRIFSKKK